MRERRKEGKWATDNESKQGKNPSTPMVNVTKDRETERVRECESNSQTERQSEIDSETESKTERDTERQSDRKRERERDRETKGQR